MRSAVRMLWPPTPSKVRGSRCRSFRTRRTTPHNHGLRIIRQPANDGEHQTPVGGRGIRPGVALSDPGLTELDAWAPILLTALKAIPALGVASRPTRSRSNISR